MNLEAVVAGGASPPGGGNGGLTFRGLPAVREMASAVHRGVRPGHPRAIIALFSWVGANGCVAAGPYRSIHLYGRENDLFREDEAHVDSLVIELHRQYCLVVSGPLLVG